MKLRIGFSPCPNDTFIFDAMINGMINTGDLQFEAVLEDVETLNQWALEGRLDITKLSYPALFSSTDKYALLDAGSALGKGVGPLLIAKSDQPYDQAGVENASIAIPGLHTTANLLLGFAYPGATNKKSMIFSSIENAVLNGETELGLIIHENRFTYTEKGLHKVMDLGEFWEQEMNIHIPLGGIAIRREVDGLISLQVQKLIRESLEYAFRNYPLISSYVKEHSQTMSEDVMRKHIDLYVNDYSLSLGEEGRDAISKLYEVYLKMNGAARRDVSLFL